MKNDSDYRNCDINDFVPAIRALTARGYYVVRVGYPVAAALELDDAKFIDYSTRFRSEFLDVYLAANCHFMISTGSGIDSMSYMFRRPILMCNLAPFSRVHSDKPWIVNLPKLHRRRGAPNLMTFSEIMTSGVGDYLVTNQYDDAAVEYLDSPPEVIRAAALEMADRVEGVWHDLPEDERRQAAFWSLLRNHPFHRQFVGVISTSFLRAFKDLLPPDNRAMPPAPEPLPPLRGSARPIGDLDRLIPNCRNPRAWPNRKIRNANAFVASPRLRQHPFRITLQHAARRERYRLFTISPRLYTREQAHHHSLAINSCCAYLGRSGNSRRKVKRIA